MTQSVLWQRICAQGLGTVAVMGMTKNTGKTVALNHLLRCAAQEGVAVGLTSIGRDGEEHDQVFSFPKPAVRVWPGMLVATARDTLARAKVPTHTVAHTGIGSPMGEIDLVQVLDEGDMEVAGASRSSDLLQLIAQLQQRGCALVLLDGALGRSHHASPAIADGIVLATGATLGGAMGDALRKTRERLALLGIASAPPALVERCRAVFVHGGVGLWDAHGGELFLGQIPTLTAAGTLLHYAERGVQTIAVSGAVGRTLWQAVQTLAARVDGLTLVVADGTRLFIDALDLAALRRLGAQLLAYRAIGIVGVTLNPVAPLGTSFDAHAFLAEARIQLAPYEVSDVALTDTLLPE